MPAAKIPQVQFVSDGGAVCKTCDWYSISSEVMEDARAHHEETLHVVQAQIKDTRTYTWSPG